MDYTSAPEQVAEKKARNGRMCTAAVEDVSGLRLC